jgi:hypothetical protein
MPNSDLCLEDDSEEVEDLKGLIEPKKRKESQASRPIEDEMDNFNTPHLFSHVKAGADYGADDDDQYIVSMAHAHFNKFNVLQMVQKQANQERRD